MSVDLTVQSTPLEPEPLNHHHHHQEPHESYDTTTEHIEHPLFNLLSNTLILNSIAPLLTLADRLALSSASRAFQALILHTPGVFRYVDLSTLKSTQWDPRQKAIHDDEVTEDEYYAAPVHQALTALQKRNILPDIQTLILDTLSVPPSLAFDLITSPSYNIRLLSLRGIKNSNLQKIIAAVRYTCRPGRSEGTSPRLRGLYIFGTLEEEYQRVGEPWWETRGKIFDGAVVYETVLLLLAAEGQIAMDAVLCRGPQHRLSPAFGKVLIEGKIPTAHEDRPRTATMAVAPCAGCGSAPEGLCTPNTTTPVNLPLLTPIPTQSSTLRAATMPSTAPTSSSSNENKCFVPRCQSCLQNRSCRHCHRWWCESCFSIPRNAGQTSALAHSGPFVQIYSEEEVKLYNPKVPVKKSCWECGDNCFECVERTQRTCKKCNGGYCLIHNEGSTEDFCDCEELFFSNCPDGFD